MPDKKISQLDPATAVFADDLFVIARGNENKKISLGDMNIINITYDDLEDLKNGENNHGNNPDEHFMTKGQWYYITDKFVYVRAISQSELKRHGLYRKHSSSRGSITLTAGNTGNVESITVDGVDILGSPVAFDSIITTTVKALAQKINDYNSTPEYTAVARGAILDIYSDRFQGIASNGFAVNGTVSGDVTLGNPVAMQGGKEVLLPIQYDFDEDVISGVVPVGFTDTETRSHQKGVKTTEDNSTAALLQMEIQLGQRFDIEGTIEGFFEEYFEAATAKVKICGWRNEYEFYVCKADLIICTPFGGEGEQFYNLSISTQSIDRIAYSNINQQNNLFELSGGGNELSVSANINGWQFFMSFSDGDIQLAIGTGEWGGETSTRNWLFTYGYRILNDSY